MCGNKALQEILSRLRKAYSDTFGTALVRVVLYGSYARHTQDEQSDIDVAAIVRGNRPELQEMLKKVWDVADDLGLEYDVVISPTVIPYDEFERFRNDLPYYANIEREGVEIGA